MNWTTLYITGKNDFREDVRERLADSNLDYMPGYIESSPGIAMYDLFWIDERTPLRKVKEAIGSKLVWKYRLRFYSNLEEFIESQNNKKDEDELSDDERDLLSTMRKSA